VTPGASVAFGEGDPLIARLAGEIDMGNARQFGDRIFEQTTRPGLGLIVDCTDVSFMDSSGIRMLLGLARRAQEREQSLVMVVPDSSSLWRILEIAGVGDVIAIERTVEDARARLAA
jgi:anti-sigma B factor antagonist